MRRAARVDANHLDICAALRLMGASVQSTATLGRGFPDAVVGFRGHNHLVEIKDGRKHWELTDDQRRFHDEWRGTIVVLDSINAAVQWIEGLP